MRRLSSSALVFLTVLSTSAFAAIPIATGPDVVWHGDFDGDGAVLSGRCDVGMDGYCRSQTIRPQQIQIVQNPVAEGMNAARFEVRHDDVYTDSRGVTYSDSRSLLDPSLSAWEDDGNERWYRWQVFLPNDYISDFPKWDQLGYDEASSTYRTPGGYNIEWHHDGDRSSPLYLATGHESFTLCLIHDFQQCAVSKELMPLVRGRWVDWLMHAKWSSNPSLGFIEIWADSGSGLTLLAQIQDSNMYQGLRNYWEVGLYRNGHIGDPSLRYGNGTQVYPNGPAEPVTVVYLDGFVIGKTKDSIYSGPAPSPTPDFTVAVSPSGVSSAPGGGTSATAMVTAQNGFSGTVSFSVSGLPSGASATFNPASVAGSGSSTLTLSAGTAACGTYSLTVAGTSGTLTRSAPLTYTITGCSAYSDAAWVKQVGTTSNEYAWGAAVDGSGNLVVTGYSMGSLWGPNMGGMDVVLAKYSSAGTALWTTQLGDIGDEHGRAVALDPAGNIYVAGSTTDAFWGVYNGGAHDAFVAKWGPNGGGEQWSNPIGTAGDDIAYAIAVDASGYIYVAGSTTGSFGAPNAGGTDAWVAKYDQFMTRIWVRQFGSWGDDEARGVAVDGAGSVYVAGSTSGAFGGATYNGGPSDAFLVKYDSAGTVQWTKIRGTSGDDHAYAVTVAAGNPVVCGSTTGNIAWPSAGGHDAWVGEYRASDGGYVFERQLGSAGEDEAFGIAANAAGDVFISGSNTASLSPNFRGGYDVFLAKYNSAGTRHWIKTLGSAGDEVGMATATDGSSVYVVGGSTAALGGPFQGGVKDLIFARFAP